MKLINAKLDFELSKSQAFIDKKYYCPHHPDTGFEGEVLELKIKCTCRKPEIGLIRNACKDYNIDLANSWMIGDQTSDIEMGKRAGLYTIGVETGFGLKDSKYYASPDYTVKDLTQASLIIENSTLL